RGRFLSADEHGGSWTVRIAYPPEVARYLVFKGSVAVEGISLTVAGLGEDYFEVAIIPKTWAVTNLSRLRAGDPVNIEADIIAKYVERILAVGGREAESRRDAGPGITPERSEERRVGKEWRSRWWRECERKKRWLTGERAV